MSQLTSSVTGHAGTIGRGGVVLAMSSGLVATMGLPAQALSKSAPEAAAPATAPIAVQPASFSGSVLASPASASQASAPLTAPAAAKVTFDESSFKAIPNKPKAAQQAGFPVGSFGSAKGASVLAIAARYVGVNYVYGGTTPGGWDCSGAMGYIFRQIGVNLPRTANQQMLASTRISASEAKAGDLVFFVSGGSAYHVGLVAGGGQMYDAGRTGKSFSKRAIYSANVIYGRVMH